MRSVESIGFQNPKTIFSENTCRFQSGNEFGFGYEFIDALTKGYLACNRGPITTSKVKYPIGKVFDRKEKKAQQSVHGILDNAGISDVVFDENAFSEYESEDLEDDNNSDNEVIQDEHNLWMLMM
eukprot:36638_1